MALDTVADYFTDARVLLQDTVVPYRNDDTSLLVGLNVALQDMRRLRADLFIGQWGTLPMQYAISDQTNTPSTSVPIEYSFRQALLHGMVAHVIERDQEDIQDGRAAGFMNVFNAVLTGRTGATPMAAPSAPPQGGR